MKARLVDKNGAKAVEINGKVFQFTAYRSWRPEEKYLKAFNDLQFPFMTLLASGIKNSHRVAYSAYGEYWIGDGEYNWDALRAQLDEFIKNAPDTYIALNLMLDTREWFLKQHPDCLNSFIYISAASAYEPWIECASKMLRDTIDFLEKEYPDKIFAIILSAGGTCEWHNKAADLPENSVRDEGFKRWSGSSKVPSEEELSVCHDGAFRNQVSQKNEIDFLKYTNDIITKTLAHFAKVVKEHSNGNLLVGAPAGYIIVGDYPLSGHCAAADMLRIPDIDIICCPASYWHRSLDGVSASQTGIDSVRLNGKLMVHSIDNTTYEANKNPYAQLLHNLHCVHENMEQSINYVKRETAMAISKGAGFWFFDMYGGWYPDEEHRAELCKMKNAYNEVFSKPVTYNAEVAMVVDSKSYIYTGKGQTFRSENISLQITQLGKIGCPVEYLSVYDILLDTFDEKKYKLLIFSDSFAPSSEIRKAVEKLRRAGVSMLFTNAAGAVCEDGFSLERASQFCGVTLSIDKDEPGAILVDGEHSGEGYPKLYGDPRKGKIAPTIKAEGDEVWGRDFFSGEGRLVVNNREKGFDAWSMRGTIPRSILRKLVEKAGVFLYHNCEMPTYANSAMAAFFSHKGGEVEIKFPYKGKIREYYTGEEFLSDGSPVLINFGENQCKLFIYR